MRFASAGADKNAQDASGSRRKKAQLEIPDLIPHAPIGTSRSSLFVSALIQSARGGRDNAHSGRDAGVKTLDVI